MLVALALVVWFANLDARHLIKSDEGRYAEIAREMAANGDWITPRLNDFKYFYKPPLQYWATAAFYRAFGVQEWTARLWPALTGLVTVLFTGFFAARLFGTRCGVYAAIVLGSSALVVGLAHVLTLDMGLACFMTVTLGGLLLAQRDGATAVQARRWMLVASAAAALGVLSKGLPALVLPGAVLVLYVLWHRDWALLQRLHAGKGIALLLTITAPWFIAVSIANPDFPLYFFWHEHVERFLTRVHGRYGPWWYFIPVLAAGLLPWTLLAPQALVCGVRLRPNSMFQPLRLLWLWAVVIVLFFSASSSKLPSYILPAFPALAVLIALTIERCSVRALRWALAPLVIAALGLVAIVPRLPRRLASPEIPEALYAAYAPWVAGAMLLLALGLLGALWLDARGRRDAALVAAGFAGLGSAQAMITGHDAFAPAQSAAIIARQVRPFVQPDVPFYSVNFYDQTLNFYIGRTVTLVEHKNELAFGIAQEPHKFVPTFDVFVQRWATDRAALAITSREYFPQVQAAGLPLVVIAADTRRVVFRKP